MRTGRVPRCTAHLVPKFVDVMTADLTLVVESSEMLPFGAVANSLQATYLEARRVSTAGLSRLVLMVSIFVPRITLS